MEAIFQQIVDASQGLLFMSESDYPFEFVQFKSNDIEKEIRSLTQKPGEPIEIQTVDYFFRNMVKTYPGFSNEQVKTAKRFLQLQHLLQKLGDVKVYRIGNVQVDAFILGKRPGGTVGGLKTKLVET